MNVQQQKTGGAARGSNSHGRTEPHGPELPHPRACPIPAAEPSMEKPALGSPGVGHKARKAASLSIWLLAIYFLELAAVQVQHIACDVPRRVCDRGAAASTTTDGRGRVRVSVPIAVPVGAPRVPCHKQLHHALGREQQCATSKSCSCTVYFSP